MKVNQVSKWEGPLTRIKTWSEMCVFMFSNLLYQKLNTKRCILSKNQTVFHHRSTWTWSLNIDVLVDRRMWCFTSWSVVNTLQQVKSLFRFGPGLLIFLGHVFRLAVESCTGSDGGEGKQLSKLCAESRLSSTRLCSYHTKTTQDGGFLCNWSWGRHEIKKKYIYSTQVTRLVSSFVFASHIRWVDGSLRRCASFV